MIFESIFLLWFIQMLKHFHCSTAVKTKVPPLLYMSSMYSSAKTDRLHLPRTVKSKIWLDYKVTPHIFMWNTQQSETVQGAQQGVYRDTDGRCVSAQPRPSPGSLCKWPPHLSAKNEHSNMSLVSSQTCPQTSERPREFGEVVVRSSEMIWEDVSALQCLVLFSSVQHIFWFTQCFTCLIC